MTVPSDASRTVDAGRLWTGGVATALVAALVAVVGLLICRGLLNVPVLAPTDEGTFGNANTFRLAGLAALAALLATGLLHLLLLSTPQPGQFFTWIVALATVAAVVATGLLHLLLLSTPQPRRFFTWIAVRCRPQRRPEPLAEGAAAVARPPVRVARSPPLRQFPS